MHVPGSGARSAFSPGSAASLPRRLLRALKGSWKTSSQPRLPEEMSEEFRVDECWGRSAVHSLEWGAVEVVLHKSLGSDPALGISLSGGGDGLCARVAALRPGSTSHTSDALSVGDYVSAVNGVRTEHMRSEQVAALLQRADPGPVALELRYPLPPPSPSGSRRRVRFLVDLQTTIRVLHSREIARLELKFSDVRPSSRRVKDRFKATSARKAFLDMPREGLFYQDTMHRDAMRRRPSKVASTEGVSVCSRVVQVSLQRDESNSLGFNIRGGSHPDPNRARALLITQVRAGGPADRSGCVRPGDRLLAVDGVSLLGASLQEAHDAIRQSAGSALVRLSLEVDVAPRMQLHGSLQGQPLLLEVERAGGDPALGLALAASPHGGVVIAGLRPGSVADRCGTLQSGDLLLAVGGTRVDEGLGPMEAAQLLATSGSPVMLQILPQRGANSAWGSVESVMARGAYSPRLGSTSSYLSSGHSTLTSQRGTRHPRRLLADSLSTVHDSSGSQCGCHSHAMPGVSHSETLVITLLPDEHGYGLSLEGSTPTLIAAIEPNSPADQSGCLLPGDRILELNQVPCVSGTQASRQLSAPALTILAQFDVAEAVVPASGVFTVKLARRGTADLGIVLSAPRSTSIAPVISDIRRGSVAYRSGALQPGDQLLEVGGSRLGAGEEAAQVLLGAALRHEVVTLRVLKGSRTTRELSRVVYSVELARHGGQLGLTIAGTEDAYHPITISALTPGGLAERTGALHSGDRLLSINGHCLQGRRLSDAIEWLQESGDRITLEISRTSPRPEETPRLRPRLLDSAVSLLGPANPSVDSAVESWSSGLDPGPGSPGSTHLKEYCAESSTVKRLVGGPGWDTRSRDSSADSGQSGGSAPLQGAESWTQGPPSTEDGSQVGDEESEEVFAVSPPRCATLPSSSRRGGSSTPSCLPDVYQVTLYKDRVYEDFGFSVSDGLYERGVYINRIRRGGPADLSGRLRPYDRILQVNETRTQDFDCCLTVPLIAAAGDSIELTVARNPFAMLSPDLTKDESGALPWLSEEVDESPITQSTLTKTL